MNKYNILETENVIFERTDYSKRSKVTIRSKRHPNSPIMTYRFPLIKCDAYKSEYISWENLDCCNGWFYDENYLKHAVQNSKKLYAGISLDENEKIKDIINGYEDFVNYEKENAFEGDKGYFICRKGCVADYIDLDAVLNTYRVYGFEIMNRDKERLLELSKVEMKEFAIVDESQTYNYANPRGIGEFLFTGLLLGYPIESSLSFLI